MPLTIRPFVDADHPAAQALAAAVDADYPRADDWHAAAQYSPGDGPFRHVAVDADTQAVVGYAALNPAHPPRHRLHLMVHPNWQRRGAGARLYQQVLDAAFADGAATLQARVRKTQSDALAFLLRRKFQIIHEMVGMHLDLARCDLTPFAAAVERIEAQGIEFMTLAQAQTREPDFLAKFIALRTAVLQDWPDPDPGPPPPLPADFHAHVLDPAQGHEDAVFLAKAGDAYVGFCGAPFVSTAVAPAYRGRGLATALKTLNLRNAQSHGTTTLLTCTAHPAMQTILTRFGYVPYCTEVRLRRMVHGFGAT